MHSEHEGVWLAVHRDRQGNCRPQLVEPYARRLAGSDKHPMRGSRAALKTS